MKKHLVQTAGRAAKQRRDVWAVDAKGRMLGTNYMVAEEALLHKRCDTNFLIGEEKLEKEILAERKTMLIQTYLMNSVGGWRKN